MNKSRVYLLFLLPLIIVGREYYPRYKENQQLEELKSQFQGLLFGEDGKVKVTSLRVEENVISMQVHISNVDLSDTNKEVLTRNSRKMLPAKICNSVGISEWLSNGKWISVDVTANGSKPVTNVRITNDNCT
ncbi:hypothetical protein EDB29_101454 [Vibrio crassostreae]|uniref:hypothetical protein n=1 Tax=Vibrio crassostreae TaxID=246167 RepID=UPI0010E2A9F2|nr:hypothetical protein [Vibrio crassostreae]TCT43647.1 hypothetical protein EDB29_101454 [Vibrio crassostreae]